MVLIAISMTSLNDASPLNHLLFLSFSLWTPFDEMCVTQMSSSLWANCRPTHFGENASDQKQLFGCQAAASLPAVELSSSCHQTGSITIATASRKMHSNKSFQLKLMAIWKTLNWELQRKPSCHGSNTVSLTIKLLLIITIYIIPISYTSSWLQNKITVLNSRYVLMDKLWNHSLHFPPYTQVVPVLEIRTLSNHLWATSIFQGKWTRI